MRAQFVFQEVWTGLRRNLTMTVALIVVVGKIKKSWEG